MSFEHQPVNEGKGAIERIYIKEVPMKFFYLLAVIAGVSIGGFAGVAGAASHNSSPGEPSIWRVDSASQQPSQRGGIVNERSTGNEPFMGPGASGGPTHSAPGATENTIKQQSQDKPQGTSQNSERQAFQRLESDPTVQGQDLVNEQREKQQ